jgi:hypothetical protein
LDAPRLEAPLRISAQEWIPCGTAINNVHTIAGEDTGEVVRIRHGLSALHGGNPDGWTKKVGKIASDKFEFDIHWYEHADIGRVDFKIKHFKRRDGFS